ncbi:hypothetical protein J437_LFUL007249 [Ladona fulva]|uniref:Uncharacterized protein n=1 Tax=Ladona fulva TaxID=123851 RepID=A0A8K0K1M4_LADFU|nr:hypothetical protein J437_LFUL007249 [Ladona fulva]
MNPGPARVSPGVGKKVGAHGESRTGEEAVKVCARTNRYVSCTVDPRPSRAVHCPDLNACLVSSADCRAVHFGYAIPVKVLPITDTDTSESKGTKQPDGECVKTDFAQLVLDNEAELSPEAVAYLLAHHPQLRQGSEEEGSEEEGVGERRESESWRRRRSLSSDSRSESSGGSGSESGGASPPPPVGLPFVGTHVMASAAAPEMPTPTNPAVTRRKFSADSGGKEAGGKMSTGGQSGKRRSSESDKTSSSTGEEEDVAAIAKQISDHAEAIYRAWKARGLGPSEILGCRPGDGVEASFSAAVIGPTATSPVAGPSFAGGDRTPTRPAVEPRQTSPTIVGPSPIRRRSEPNQSPSLSSSPSPIQQPPPSVEMLLDDAPGLERLVSNFVVEDKARQRQRKKELPSSIQSALQKFERKNSQPIVGSSANVGVTSPVQPPSPSSSVSPQAPSIQPKPILQQPIQQSMQPQQQPSGTTTWPLKVRGAKSGPDAVKKEEVPANKFVSSESPVSSPTSPGVAATSAKYATLPARKITNRGTDEQRRLADVVDREEERLIQALRTGVVLAPEDDLIDQRTSPVSAVREDMRSVSQNVSSQPQMNSTRIEGNRFNLRKTVTPMAPVESEAKKEVPPHTTPEDGPLTKPDTVVTNGGGNREVLSGLSLVDYAKARYKAAQARLDDARQQSTSPVKETASLVSVSETRSRFERAVNSNFSQQQWTPPSTDVFQRRKQARGIGSSIGEVVPHPELTSQQKQHIRERSGAVGQGSWNQGTPGGTGGSGTAASGSGNPVRPFLTRGSVAERVLIFERCPSSEILEKRKAPAVIGSVHTRSQVCYLWFSH